MNKWVGTVVDSQVFMINKVGTQKYGGLSGIMNNYVGVVVGSLVLMVYRVGSVLNALSWH